MNIVTIVSYPFLPAKTGGQKGIALFYKYFSRFHDVTIVTTKKNQADPGIGYEVQTLLSNHASRYFNPFIFFRIRKLIREKKASHLILEHPYYGWLGFLLKKSCGVRLVVHSHNIESKRWRSLGKWWWRILERYERFTHRQADYNFFIQDEDRQYAIQQFGLDEQKCLTVSFGTEIDAPPPEEKHRALGRQIREEHEIPESHPLLLFNGAFAYTPNREALENLVYRVNPILHAKDLSYTILIVGLDIPVQILNSEFPNIKILGFAENLEDLLTGCDIFLNTVRSGGGIKTKLVEALAYNLTAVSTKNGAIGIDPALCDGKLIVAPDHNWSLFAEAIIKAMHVTGSVPEKYYQQFYWEHITKRAAEFIHKQNG